MVLSDFDGVINLAGELLRQHVPSEPYAIITGRAIDESPVVFEFLSSHGMSSVPVYFNPILYKNRGDHSFQSRLYSAKHKVATIEQFLANHVPVDFFQEDDPLQLEFIRQALPELELRFIDTGGSY